MFKTQKDITDGLFELRKQGNPKGENTGFRCLDDIYTIKQGAFTIILAEPHHGKSEFAFELLLNQNRKYGKKSMVYSPETGTVEEIYAELIHKYTGRHVFEAVPGHMDEKTLFSSINHVYEYFRVVNSDYKSYSYEELMEGCTDEELILADPNNEVLQNFMAKYGNRQDLYIEDISGEIRRWCRKRKKHMIITMHPAVQEIVKSKDNSHPPYYPMPKARQAAGGQAWFRKAMGWINLWRPPVYLNDEYGYPYADNTLIGSVEKAKPKGIGKRGQFQLHFDWKTNRYYEKVDGLDMYAFGHEENKSVLMPSINFYEKEEHPF